MKRNFKVDEFEENDYTTKLDLDELTSEIIKEAEEKEKEILMSKNDYFQSRHILEERNLIEL